MLGLVLFLAAVYLYFSPAKRYQSIFIIFLLVTAGFQLIPVNLLTFPGVSKCYDWLLLFLGAITVIRPSVMFSTGALKEFGNIKWFLLLLIVLAFYSVFVENIEASVAIRVLRNFLFLLFIVVFCGLDREELVKVFRLVVYGTSIASLVYCSQNLVGTTILNLIGGEDTANYLAEPPMIPGVIRYYNIPVLVVPVLFLLMYDKSIVSSKWRKLLIAPNAIACLLSQHRNLIIAILICFVAYYLLKRSVSMVKLAMLLLVFAGATVVINEFTNNRLFDGFSEIHEIAANGISAKDLATAELAEISTSKFRIYHFYERLNYIMQDAMHATLGLGLLTEDSHFVKSLDFRIGLADETYHVTQVDTSDIAWSLFIINFGILGTILFVSIYTNLFSRFFKVREDEKMLSGILFIIVLLFTSFYGVSLIHPATFCMLMLFAAWHYRLKFNE